MSKIMNIILVGAGLLFIISCVPEIIPYESMLDTPSRHYKNGMKLLQAGKIDASLSEFDRSLEIDKEYAPGYVGLGLVSGLNGNYSDALKKLTVAGLYTRDRQEMALVHIGFMRVYLLGTEEISADWFNKIEEHYKKAILLAPEIPDAYFFMGVAYQKKLKPEKASEKFARVINMNGDFASEAAERMSMLQHVTIVP